MLVAEAAARSQTGGSFVARIGVGAWNGVGTGADFSGYSRKSDGALWYSSSISWKLGCWNSVLVSVRGRAEPDGLSSEPRVRRFGAEQEGRAVGVVVVCTRHHYRRDAYGKIIRGGSSCEIDKTLGKLEE